ncbi:hypothetical protein TNCV_178341 [Trichonephila clavipes]|nr:hypothetical protein TNCV_178341 [Trichonephila clavipes]
MFHGFGSVDSEARLEDQDILEEFMAQVEVKVVEEHSFESILDQKLQILLVEKYFLDEGPHVVMPKDELGALAIAQFQVGQQIQGQNPELPHVCLIPILMHPLRDGRRGRVVAPVRVLWRLVQLQEMELGWDLLERLSFC